MTRDYKGRIESIKACRDWFNDKIGVEETDTIIHALKLADKVTGEPSEGMVFAAKNLRDEIQDEDPCDTLRFSTMIAQAQKEIEND